MARKIIIRHLSGTRTHQVDAFPTDGLKGISFGRDETSNVKFDAQHDDVVSRLHLGITPEGAGSEFYTVTDQNSRNGTFLNRQRISQPTRIHHGDVIQLGPGGPEFVFELDPPPASEVKETRVMNVGELSSLSRSMPTREISTISPVAGQPIGRATVERMLGDTFGKVKKESNKTLWIGIAALVLISVVGGTLFLMMHSSNEESAAKAQQQQQILLNMANTVKQPQALDPAVKARIDQMSTEMAKLMQQNRELIAAKNSAPGGGQTQPRAQRAAQGSSGEGYDEAFAKASNEYSSGHPDAAYSDSYALISADGNRYEAYYLAALCLSSMNRPADAIPVYEFALQNAPDSVKSSIAQKLADARAASQRGGAAQSQN